MAATRAASTPRRRGRARGDEREHALLDALARLLADRPLQEISIADVVAEAGVGRTAFYFYFPSREAALQALVERSLASIWQTGREWMFGSLGDPRAALQEAVDGLVRAWAEHGTLLAAVADAAAYDAEVWEFWQRELESFIDACAARIERDRESGLTHAELDPRGTAEALCWMNERYCRVYLGASADAAAQGRARRFLAETWYHAIYAG